MSSLLAVMQRYRRWVALVLLGFIAAWGTYIILRFLPTPYYLVEAFILTAVLSILACWVFRRNRRKIVVGIALVVTCSAIILYRLSINTITIVNETQYTIPHMSIWLHPYDFWVPATHFEPGWGNTFRFLGIRFRGDVTVGGIFSGDNVPDAFFQRVVVPGHDRKYRVVIVDNGKVLSKEEEAGKAR